MQDLSRLGIGSGVFVLRLVCREVRQDPARNRRIHPQALQARDQRVAPEHRAEPGNAGVGVRAFRQICDQHVEIGHGSADRFVEDLVRSLDCGGTGGGSAQRPPGVAQRAEKEFTRGSGEAVRIATNLDEHRGPGIRIEVELEDGAVGLKLRRRGIEAQPGLPSVAVEAGVGERRGIALDPGRVKCATALASHTPHLEQVGEIRRELEVEPDALAAVVEVPDGKTLEAGRIPHELGSAHVHQVMAEHEPTALVDIRIGQVAGQGGVVVPEGRA